MEEQKRKIKILMLGSMDFDLAGHVFENYKNLPLCFDKRIVVKYTVNGNKDIAIFDSKTNTYNWRRRFDKYIYIPFMRFLRFGIIRFQIDMKKTEYCFYDNEIEYISAKKILSKHKGFVPDIISVHWSSNFITSKIIRDLYELTHAKIVLMFVDQAHMTGGCHYPVDCLGYQNNCQNCPAILKGKDLARKQLARKIKYLKNVPITICGAPNDCMLAIQKSKLLSGCNFIESVRYPNVIKTPREIARKRYGINSKDFVILIGASKVTEKRKGFSYASNALKILASKYSNVCVLVAGQIEDKEIYDLKQLGLKLLLPGYVSVEELYVLYSASDCFLSTTIADSGPMMVNFAMALGIPVVSFDIGIASTLIVHKKTGYVAKVKDFNDLAKGLEFIRNLSNSEWQMMSNECTDIIGLYKNQDDKYLTIYNRYIDGTL